MAILAGMFETLFTSYCSVCLSEGFFLALQHRKIAKAKKQAFFKLNNCQKNFSIACAEQQRFIILNSCNFACKYKKITEIYRFESAQILLSLISWKIKLGARSSGLHILFKTAFSDVVFLKLTFRSPVRGASSEQ